MLDHEDHFEYFGALMMLRAVDSIFHAVYSPEMKAKLLQGLGLQGYMVTDGSSPINLFKTADGMISSSNPGNL